MNTTPYLLADPAFKDKYESKTIVIKAGGELFMPSNEHLVQNLFHQLLQLKAAHVHPMLVHGCGPQLTAAFAKAGAARIADTNGNFITTDDTIELVANTMSALNTNICEGFNAVAVQTGLQQKYKIRGCDMRAFSAKSPFIAQPLYQRTGTVSGIKAQELADKLIMPFVPILSSLGVDENGAPYNINADDVACAIAIEVKAPRLMLLSSTPGVLDDQGNTITFLDQTHAQELIDLNVISGGMKKKVMQMLAAAEKIDGVAALSYGEPFGILKELLYQHGADSATLVKTGPQPGGMA